MIERNIIPYLCENFAKCGESLMAEAFLLIAKMSFQAKAQFDAFKMIDFDAVWYVIKDCRVRVKDICLILSYFILFTSGF